MTDPRLKVYTEQERPLPPQGTAGCYDCGLLYSGPAWADVLVPDYVWEEINPSPHKGGGLLCFNCMNRRLVEIGYDLGMGGVQFAVVSGPFAGPDEDAKVKKWMADIELAEKLAEVLRRVWS